MTDSPCYNQYARRANGVTMPQPELDADEEEEIGERRRPGRIRRAAARGANAIRNLFGRGPARAAKNPGRRRR